MELFVMPETEFGKRLVQLRKAAGMTQAALAEKAGVSLPGVRMLEQGRREPSWSTLLALAKALNVKLDDFQQPKRKGK